MKEFNYERAKAGDPVCTRDGRDARIVCWDIKCKAFQLVVAIADEYAEEFVLVYNKDGKITGGAGNTLDLFMKPIKKTYWVNVKIYKGRRHIGTYPIEIEE